MNQTESNMYDEMTKVAAFEIVQILRGLEGPNEHITAQLRHVTQARVARFLQGEMITVDDVEITEITENEEISDGPQSEA